MLYTTTNSISAMSMPCDKHAGTVGIIDDQMKIRTIPTATVATRHLRVQVEDWNRSCITLLVFCVREAWNMLTDSLR